MREAVGTGVEEPDADAGDGASRDRGAGGIVAIV